MNDELEKFQILSLSGGGYKGLYTASLIAKFEENTGKPFATHFNLITGTSIGGIIALALAFHIPAQKIVDTLTQYGPQIFKPQLISTLTFGLLSPSFTPIRGLWGAKHRTSPLKKALEELFGDYKMKDLKSSVLITSVNWTEGKAQMFKKYGEHYTSDGRLSLVDVALATSAAPVYFPHHKINHQIYIDGGVVGNAPSLFGFHEAVYKQGKPQESIRQLASLHGVEHAA